MGDVTLPLNGGCQCSALRYQVTTPPMMIYACHCTTCQKQTGSAFVLSAIINEATFSFSAGEPSKFEWTSDAGNRRYGYFCKDCGNRVANGQTPTSGVLSLRAGTFDDTSWVRPAGHIWVASAQSWIKFEKEDILFDAQPTDYASLVERFRGFGLFATAN